MSSYDVLPLGPVTSCGEVELGDSVRYQGRRYTVHGFTRAGSADQHVVLEDGETGELVTVPLAEVEPADPA